MVSSRFASREQGWPGACPTVSVSRSAWRQAGGLERCTFLTCVCTYFFGGAWRPPHHAGGAGARSARGRLCLLFAGEQPGELLPRRQRRACPAQRRSDRGARIREGLAKLLPERVLEHNRPAPCPGARLFGMVQGRWRALPTRGVYDRREGACAPLQWVETSALSPSVVNATPLRGGHQRADGCAG